MRQILWLLLFLQLSLFADRVDPRLMAYQERYSLCHGKSDYTISECLLNGDLDYSRFRGDRGAYRKIDKHHIAEAVAQGRAYAFTMQQIPKTERYRGLVAYIDYLEGIQKAYVVPRFSGDEEDDIVKMKHLFNLLLLTDMEETPERTPEFEAALLAYQEREGLAVDGKIGARTRKALQQSIERIIVKLKKNLTIERISMPKPSTYVRINIPEYQMHYYENDTLILSMKIVVGKPKMRTPIFNRKMKFIVENPTWNVPPSIYKKEYAHKSESQLRKLGLRYNREGKLYQPSGRRNALGAVKFLFPNKFNVYMHDTPAKHLFNRVKRAYSHGCIRLEKPMVLLQQLGYSYHRGKTQWITLKEEIPVFVEYHTAWIDEEGQIQFRRDIYGYEKKFFTRKTNR